MNIEFRHIHTYSPWEGGFYERQVGSVKTPLKIALGKHLWTFLEIQTILCDIEAMINNRPLTMVGSDPEDMTAITPALLMTGRPMGNLWCEKSPSEDIADSPAKLWARRQEVADVYWKRFQKEYLLELQSRSKWTNEAMIDLDVGDVVLLADQPKKQRSEWQLAIVTELRRGRRNEIRSVTVRQGAAEKGKTFPKGKSIEKSIRHIVPLEGNLKSRSRKD